MLARKALAGTAGAPKEYVEDVFSTYLWTGNATARDIVNGIDLAGEGGLVWTKRRNDTNVHQLTDTARGVSYQLNSASTAAESNEFNRLTAFNADGFSISTGTDVNANTGTYTSWTFRKAKKFFDVVTYTGNGTAGRTVSHNLGSVPGVIIVKCTSAADNWTVYHRSLGGTKFLELNATGAAGTSASRWNDTDPTSTVFTVGSDGAVNGNGSSYVAYLFAHDAGGFGDAGSDNVISCGSYTEGASAQDINLGYEPQWLLMKKSSGASGWYLFDTMRGMDYTDLKYLEANTSGAESSFGVAYIKPTATGFTAASGFFGNGSTIIYIAIRRGPMKTPETGTSVFTANGYTGNSSAQSVLSGFVTDLGIFKGRNESTYGARWYDRLRASSVLVSSSTGSESDDGAVTMDQMSGFRINSSSAALNNSSYNYISLLFKRAPGFFDVVCYTGTGANRTVSHNLGVAPELILFKIRNATSSWVAYSATLGATKYLIPNSSASEGTSSTMFNDTAPTSSVFTVGTNVGVNQNTNTYVAYLFASVSGVSKVGSYTGNGSSVTVTTGFQPRFVLVKRTDVSGNWIYGDSDRGLVAGNDPYSLINTTAAEDTDEDWVDVSSTGFTVNETTAAANTNTGTYIYLAIA